jgi:hypothetical protein
VGLLALIVFWLVWLLYQSAAVVRGKQLAVLERRWISPRMPEGRVVVLRSEVGVQANLQPQPARGPSGVIRIEQKLTWSFRPSKIRCCIG